MKAQKIYIIKSDTDIKIGVSVEPKRRLTTLQCANPSRLELIYESERYENAIKIESACHKELEEYRGLGEWFNCSIARVINAVAQAESIIGITSSEVLDNSILCHLDNIISSSKVIGNMHSTAPALKEMNEYRKLIKTGKKQLGSYFNLDSTKSLISEICIARDLKISDVKTSSRGKFGGTYLVNDLFIDFLNWGFSTKIITKDYIFNKSIEKAQSHFRGNK